MPWTALIGAGTSLLGGLFGRSKEKRERRQALEDREYARGHYKRLVKDASAAGFNPLTALRNGGGAGYASSSAPILSSGGTDPMQTALSQVGSFIANFDPHADTAREKSYALLDAQVRNLNASSGAIFPAMPGGFHSPGTYGGTFEGRPSGRSGSLSKPLIEAGDRTATDPYVQALIDSTVPDAGLWGERYGEPGEYAGAYSVARADLKKNLREAPGVVGRTALQIMRDVSFGSWPMYAIETWGPELGAFDAKLRRKGEKRRERISRQAAENARNLRFPPGW